MDILKIDRAQELFNDYNELKEAIEAIGDIIRDSSDKTLLIRAKQNATTACCVGRKFVKPVLREIERQLCVEIDAVKKEIREL